MARGRQTDDELVHERPAWMIPLLVFAGVLIFSGIFLYYYFGPTPGELLGRDARASSASSEIEAIIADQRFVIPENYTRYPAQRGGGRMNMIDMHALLPGLLPYSPDQQESFADNSIRSNVIYFSLSQRDAALNSSRRLKDIYSKYLASAEPEEGPDGLQLFRFRDNTGYANQDLLVGKDAEERILLLICDRRSAQIESPNCYRSLLLGPRLEMSYRYKRHHLDSWRMIDRNISALVDRFAAIERIDDLQGSIAD
ncbi:hypothetical protein [Parvibaculum sp.]|uniref:hypothetical protein n=1 Tax=Parvibaculum sp. TaxID=2024848 RepID=UPI00391D2C70